MYPAPLVLELKSYQPVLTIKEKLLIKLEGIVEAVNAEIEAKQMEIKKSVNFAQKCSLRMDLRDLQAKRTKATQDLRNAW